jgi:hypothetical protein
MEWIEEEMMAYLGWDKAEEDHIEAQDVREIETNPLRSKR